MDERKAVARRFGELVTELAKAKGFDVSPGAGGRSQLAAKLDMHVSMVSRALDGDVLPQPWQFKTWARVLEVPLRNLMVETKVISADDWPEDEVPDVLSVTARPQNLTPEAVMDAWHIDNPIIRRGLKASMENALAMQAEENERCGTDGGAAARG
jgi:transcriptional regulator with XRE-family HTH domain